MPDTPITFEDVRVFDATPLSLRCQVNGKMVRVGRAQMLEGTTIANAGDRGRLVVRRVTARDLGLVEPS